METEGTSVGRCRRRGRRRPPGAAQADVSNLCHPTHPVQSFTLGNRDPTVAEGSTGRAAHVGRSSAPVREKFSSPNLARRQPLPLAGIHHASVHPVNRA